MREIKFHEIPEAYARQTAAMLDAAYEAEYASQVQHEMMDELHPGWENDEIDPEDRRFIDWSDVEDADEATVRPDLTYVPGADD